MLKNVYSWGIRRVFDGAFRLTMKRLWRRKDLTAAELRRRTEAVSHLLDKNVRPGKPEAFGPGLEGEWFAPDGRDDCKAVVLYLHGGAFVTYPVGSYRRFSQALANLLQARVFLPNYRLAPEHPYPTPGDDCLAAYRQVLAGLGGNSEHLVVGGDSAGGNLTLATLIRARDEGLALPRCAFAFSPVTDLTFSGASVNENERTDAMFTKAAIGFVRGVYLSAPADVTRPDASPLFADLTGLPPLLFQCSSSEMLRDDSVRMAERVRAAGGSAELAMWRDLPHVFQLVDAFTETRQARTQLRQFVDRNLTR
ncbi:alpha/beta hydrolase [uncultured Dechloromonas sp.]|uniref:alpha/beta hydrolase n=1 Tax=uncultured Dechloromonas sp. TaxID=171719 RepID=UPI0025FDC1EB|nr:alpha/beta hydrolase [uncultured Dechloromonas sp.]